MGKKKEKVTRERAVSSGYGEAETLQRVKYFDIRAARDLRYSEAIIEELKQATTTAELTKIMAKGRKQKFG